MHPRPSTFWCLVSSAMGEMHLSEPKKEILAQTHLPPLRVLKALVLKLGQQRFFGPWIGKALPQSRFGARQKGRQSVFVVPQGLSSLMLSIQFAAAKAFRRLPGWIHFGFVPCETSANIESVPQPNDEGNGNHPSGTPPKPEGQQAP
ncbi:protein of unknown function (plasmid) [Candidatus Methylocalor cossyra]|uniref:Uncharacterized protein n=1 Tax=Candidatus Methylocalor cossyra TaxID=3108543 RepID=A0ABP1CD61_9GAMM